MRITEIIKIAKDSQVFPRYTKRTIVTMVTNMISVLTTAVILFHIFIIIYSLCELHKEIDELNALWQEQIYQPNNNIKMEVKKTQKMNNTTNNNENKDRNILGVSDTRY